MERLHHAMATRRDELTRVLVTCEGFDVATARRFLLAAADDLAQSHRWLSEHEPLDPSPADEARHLLGFVHGKAIASAAGVPVNRTWQALRMLVPCLLRAKATRAALDRTA